MYLSNIQPSFWNGLSIIWPGLANEQDRTNFFQDELHISGEIIHSRGRDGTIEHFTQA